MTPRQQCFVEAYARLKHARAAAIEAGYSARCAAPIASRLLRRPEIAAALAAAGVELAVTPHGPKDATQIRPALNARREAFVAQYLILGNAAEAARRAGYSKRSASGAAAKLMRSPAVRDAIAAAEQARAARLSIDGDHVLYEYACLAFAQLGMVVDWGKDGAASLKPLEELAPEVRAALSEIVAVSDKNGSRLKVKLFDKGRALDALAKHLRLFDENAWRPAEKKLINGRDPREVLRERVMRLVPSLLAAKKPIP